MSNVLPGATCSAVIKALVCAAIALILISIPAGVRTDTGTEAPLPTVLMVEMEGATPNSPELFKAIRAQLSASPMRVHRINADSAMNDPNTLKSEAVRLALKYRAAVVFWIEDGARGCTVSFHVRSNEGNRFYTRSMDLKLNSRQSRFEVIANAVSGLLEESVASLETNPEPRKPPPPPKPPPEKVPEPKRKKAEFTVAYSGSYFADQVLLHGVRIGFGLLPGDHVAVGISYTQNLTLQWENPNLRFSIASRDIDAFLAGRLSGRSVELRLGLACSVNLRSHSLASSTETILPRSEDMKGVVALVPFLSLAWTFLDRFAIVTGVGASIPLNEKDYTILRHDLREETVAKPFPVKLTYGAGLSIQL